jgi:uncharacterized membrane protein (GlpM family)
MRILRVILVVVVVVGLVVDAYVHLTLASTFDPIRATISQGQLFRIEGYAALLAAAFLLIRPGRPAAALAALVAGGGVAAVLLYAVVDVGPLGPLPNMYDPTWSTLKTWSAVAEVSATLAAVALLAVGVREPARYGEGQVLPRAGSGALGR